VEGFCAAKRPTVGASPHLHLVAMGRHSTTLHTRTERDVTASERNLPSLSAASSVSAPRSMSKSSNHTIKTPSLATPSHCTLILVSTIAKNFSSPVAATADQSHYQGCNSILADTMALLPCSSPQLPLKASSPSNVKSVIRGSAGLKVAASSNSTEHALKSVSSSSS